MVPVRATKYGGDRGADIWDDDRWQRMVWTWLLCDIQMYLLPCLTYMNLCGNNTHLLEENSVTDEVHLIST